MKRIFTSFLLLFFTNILLTNNTVLLPTPSQLFTKYQQIISGHDPIKLHQFITQIETIIKTHNLETNHELFHFLQHVYEHKEAPSKLNTKIVPVCTITNCAFHASFINKLVANCITSNNLIVNSDTIINGALCVSGGINCPSCTYDTIVGYYFSATVFLQQIPTTTFQNIIFNYVGSDDGNWTYDGTFNYFYPATPGWYLINYDLFYKNAPVASIPFTGTISSRLILDGTDEIYGSQASIAIDATTSTNSILSNNYLGRSVVSYIAAGQPLAVQHITSANPSGDPVIYLEADGDGNFPTSASISMLLLKIDNS